MTTTTSEKFYLKLSKFVRVLPPKSKAHIWEHSVTVKLGEGKKTVLNQTNNSQQIKSIISDSIIVYCKVQYLTIIKSIYF